MALHAAAVVALLQYQPLRSALSDAAPIMVSLITPAPVVEKLKQRPKVPQERAKPASSPAIDPPPLLTTSAETPAQQLVAPPPPLKSPPIDAVPSQATASGPALVSPPPIIPPKFDAEYLDNPPPKYPPMARRLGEQGKVMLRVLVNAAGSADKVELKSSSGSERLDSAAIETVKRWRFVPAHQGEHSLAAWVLIPITFTLEG